MSLPVHSSNEVVNEGAGRLNLGAVVALLPVLCLSTLSVVWTLGSFLGGGLWPPDDVTLAEAAATGNRGEVMRLIALGQDPNGRSIVRAEMLRSRTDHFLTPLEAAVWDGDSGVVRLLLENGAIPDLDERHGLRCLAAAVRQQETEAFLATLWPDSAWTCEGFELP